MKNKKADITLEGVLKIVLAVLCIFILVFLAGKLYNMLIKSHELEEALAMLTEIATAIDKTGDGQSREIILTSPENWYLVFYSEYDIIDGKAPNKCGGEKVKGCVCLCPEDNFLKNKELQSIEWGLLEDVHKRIEKIENRFYEEEIIERCSTGGLCQTLSKNIRLDSYFSQPSGAYYFKQRQVVFAKNWVSMLWLKSVYIEQKDGLVIINEDTPESSKFLDNLLKEEFKIPELGNFKSALTWWISDAFNHCSYTHDREVGDKKNVQNGIKEYLRNKEIGGWVYVFAVDEYGVIDVGFGKTTFDTSESNKLYENSKKIVKKICDVEFKVFAIYVPEKE